MSDGRSPTRHYCDHADCGKSFRRAEHLNRHKLNHTNSTIKCPKCDHLFYRRDLLKRHLILKHKVSKAAFGAEETSPPFEFDVSPPGVQDNAHSPAQPAYGLQGHAEPSPQETSLTVASPVNGLTVADLVLPISGDVFPFPSPGLDLAQDWAWFNQYPLPVIPVNSGAEGQTSGHNGMPEIQSLNDDWINAGNTQGLYISQEVFEYLLSLIPVVEVTRTFTLEDATSILNSAFVFIIEALPIFHQPTFSLDLIQNELCASIFCVGLLISHEPASYRIGCALLGQIRSKLIHYVNNNTIYLTDLEVLQAMLLNEFSGMYLADRTAMELSDIFHGTLVTLSRRLDLFEMTTSIPDSSSTSGNQNERQILTKSESAKRLAYFVFALDIEHALLFGHERSILSVYSMKLELPSDDADWQTLGSSLQTTQHPMGRRTRYHVLCHSLLSATSDPTTITSTLNPLSSFLVLLGLASVALDLLRRQQDPFFDTKQALTRLGSVLPIVHNRLMTAPGGPMRLHGRAVYHITAIALCTPLEDLERAANDGFSRTGRTPKQHTRAAIIRLLTKHKVGAEPARHAIHLLKLYLVPDDLVYQAPTSTISGSDTVQPAGYSRYEPSALYFGVLTLWAYVIGRVSDDDDDSFQLDERPALSTEDVHGLQHLSSSQPTQEAIHNLLQGLEEAIDGDDSLACRRQWRVLVQHVAARLASRWNNNAQEYSQVLKSLSDNLSI